MTDIERLQKAFIEGRLVRPSATVPNTIDLIRRLATWAGIPNMDGPNAARLREHIGEARHILFLVVDGMGCALLDRAPEGGFLRTHVAEELQAICPATTAAAMVSLATGLWPCEHAVPGWSIRLAPPALRVMPLPFIDCDEGRDLRTRNISREDVFPVPSIWSRAEKRVLMVIEAGLADTVFTTYQTGDTKRIGVKGITGVLQTAAACLREADAPTFAYAYLPQVDHVCHHSGTDHWKVRWYLEGIDARLARIREELPDDVRIVVSADHGELDVPPERRFALGMDDALGAHLVCPPTCEPRMPVFHVKEGHADAFATAFRECFADRWALVTPKEAEELCLFGPGPLTDLTRLRLGTFIGVALEPAVIFPREKDGTALSMAGYHAGLTPKEMLVPLIVA